MVIRKKISKIWAIRLALFTALIVAAIIGDIYIKKHHIDLSKITNTAQDDADASESFYVVATTNGNVSISFKQNLPIRSMFFKMHNRFLQNIHQNRDKQLLRMKIKLPPPPSKQLAMVIKMKENYCFSFDDEENML